MGVDHHIYSFSYKEAILCPGSFLRADLELPLLLTTGPTLSSIDDAEPHVLLAVAVCCCFYERKRSRETWPKFRNTEKSKGC